MDTPQGPPVDGVELLRELNRYIAGLRPPAQAQELASARRFHHAREAQQTLDKVDDAVARKPANAGPLNSHALVLQSLELMRSLSPHYLRQFVPYVETLLWLDGALQKPGSSKAGPARRAPARAKSGRGASRP
jgi:hypothetical protein